MRSSDRGAHAALAAQGARFVLVAVTDGEASAPERAEELRRVRPRESARAASVLGTIPHFTLLAQTPRRSTCVQTDVEAPLVSLLEPGDLVLAPWAHDGHPDHDEVGVAAERACAGADAPSLGVSCMGLALGSTIRTSLGEGPPGRARQRDRPSQARWQCSASHHNSRVRSPF